MRIGDLPTALHLAAYPGDVEMATMLLTRKGDLNAKNDAGGTALQLAEREGRKEMADFLRQ
jgi:ankyrin repeat protein